MARIRCPRYSLLRASSGLVGTPLSRTLSSERAFRSRPSPPRAPLLQRHYPPSLLIRAHAQIPVPLVSISCPALIGGAPAACTIHGWSSGPSRFGPPFFPGVLRPLYRGSPGAHNQFFPDDFGLRPIMRGSASASLPPNGFSWA